VEINAKSSRCFEAKLRTAEINLARNELACLTWAQMPPSFKRTADDSLSTAKRSPMLAAFLSDLQERVNAFTGKIGDDELGPVFS
jgi:uncharacterized protein YecE (DUF72 family)